MPRRAPALAVLLALGLAAGAASALTLRSPTVTEGAALPLSAVNDAPGCPPGGNVSPALIWSAAPAGTRGFALTLFDPDARGGAGWWHWAVYDIPANARGLPAGAGAGAGLPAGAAQAKTSFGTAVYGGACPPPGPAHHYVFTVYALKRARLDLPPGADAAAVARAAQAAALAEARLTATFGR